MKATDLLQLVTEREADEMNKVSYKNDKTPDNHVKNKRMKTVNPLPDKGEKNDKHPKANVGDVRGKERRSMEGPKTGVKKMSEQAPSAAGVEVEERPFSQRQAQVSSLLGLSKPQKTGSGYRLTMTDTRQRPFTKKTMDVKPQQLLKMINYVKSASDDSVMAFYQSVVSKAGEGSNVAGNMGGQTGGHNVGAPMSQQQIGQAGAGWQLEDEGAPGIEVDEIEPEEIEAMPAGMDVRHHDPEEITMRGHARQREGLGESGVENAGSMKKKQTVQKSGPCCKSASVRSGQNDSPKPTADVGKPKKKERRSMDANPAPVKDWKGGSNEHKKMGMHEGVRELEKLLHREIDTTFLEGDMEEAMVLPKTKVDPKRATGSIAKAAASANKKKAKRKDKKVDEMDIPRSTPAPRATGSIAKAAASANKKKAMTTKPKGKAKKGSFWSKAEKHM